MSFNSYVFLLAFLPATLLIYWWMQKKGKDREAVLLLIFASLIFCGASSISGLLVLIISMAVNYLLALKMWSKCDNCEIVHKKYIIAGVIFNITLLSLFKYGPLFIPIIGDAVTAPGISFYTFCEIAFLVEVYRGCVGKLSVREYSFIITFFPKMIQGPITLPSDLLNQKAPKSLGWEKIYRLLLLLAFGMFKKVIIADTLGRAVNFGFDSLNSMHTGEALVIMLSYTLQLYFDFSGYCDMAIAIAGLFGYDLPVNFNSPYKAVNIDDFWKRWHITLTRFFTKYIYIPLGGNRKGVLRTYINFLIIFLISGLWHGAGWQFIIWGLMHGGLYVATRMVQKRKEGRMVQKATGSEMLQNADTKGILQDAEPEKMKQNKFIKALKVFLTFLYVNIAWVFFRAPSVKDAVHLFKDMAECWFPRFNKDLANCFNIDEFWYVIKILHLDRWTYGIYILMFVILIVCLILVFFAPTALEFTKKCKINVLTTVVMAVLFAWCILSFEGVATYLYVNF